MIPVAFISIKDDVNPNGHWLLVIQKTTDGVEVYDPKTGLREIGLGGIERIWYFSDRPRQHVPEYFLAQEYSLPRKKLEELGTLQEEGSGYCGQLCVFAARYAKGI